jgi:hypothetical protein
VYKKHLNSLELMLLGVKGSNLVQVLELILIHAQQTSISSSQHMHVEALQFSSCREGRLTSY